MDTRPMTAADIEAGLRFCRAAGWNQLEADWRLFLEFSPKGCRVAVCDERVAGTVATLRFGKRFSWISMLLVDPEMRGRGIGRLLFRESLRLLDDMETIRLDATPAGKRVYDRFDFADEYGLVRMKAPAPAVTIPAAASISGVRPIADSDMAGIVEMDREIFGADRGAILRHLYARAPEYAFAAESGNAIQGFSFGRHGFLAEHLGPVVAWDEARARSLVSACLARIHGPALMDVPRHTATWVGWLESLGFREERPFIRMFRGRKAYPGLPERQFAIAGPELG